MLQLHTTTSSSKPHCMALLLQLLLLLHWLQVMVLLAMASMH
jgi:hypothetical protein